MFYFKYIIANNLHKGDQYNNNNNNNNNNKEIPVIIGRNGTITKSFRQYPTNIPGKHEIKDLQTTAVFGTAHILQKALM
jgi:hypothetical protein